MTTLLLDTKVVKIARALETAEIPYAFGGAISLAYCATPRGTEDIDLNLFIDKARAHLAVKVLQGLGIQVPKGESIPSEHELLLRWDHTPIHAFFSYDPFHESCEARRRRVPFADGEIWILSAEDIAIFKIIYDRPKDRSEVREILLCLGERMDTAYVRDWLERLLGAQDDRVKGFVEATLERAAGSSPGSPDA